MKKLLAIGILCIMVTAVMSGCVSEKEININNSNKITTNMPVSEKILQKF